MLDQMVDDRLPIGVARPDAGGHSELVDHADERSGSDRGPDGQYAEPKDAAIGLRDEDRRGWDEQEVPKVIGLVTPGTDGVDCEHAHRSVEVCETGDADVNLHQGSLSGVAATCMLHRATVFEDTTKRLAPRERAPV
jgi:hypothetical protein